MARKTFPRRDEVHRVAASHALAKYAQATGNDIELPVPIELIIETVYNLEILWEEVAEPPDTILLGALAPSERRVVLNTRHQDLFERWVGPERFTLAHELAHWIYDADNPDQMSLDLDQAPSEQFCYSRESPGLSEDLRIREVNANKFASHILLPDHLIRAANIEEVLSDARGTAAAWGVSQTALRIRLETMGLINAREAEQLFPSTW